MRNTRIAVNRVTAWSIGIARQPSRVRHHSRAAGSVNGRAWQASAAGAIATRIITTAIRTIQLTNSIAASTAMSSPMINASRLVPMLDPAPRTWVRIWLMASLPPRESPVNAPVNALARVMSSRHSGVAKFAATNPITSRGASSPTPYWAWTVSRVMTVIPATRITSTNDTLTTVRARLDMSATCGNPVTSGVVNTDADSRSNSPVSAATTAWANQVRTASKNRSISAAEDALEDTEQHRRQQRQRVADPGRFQ